MPTPKCAQTIHSPFLSAICQPDSHRSPLARLLLCSLVSAVRTNGEEDGIVEDFQAYGVDKQSEGMLVQSGGMRPRSKSWFFVTSAEFLPWRNE
jgi:hypothetical protein